MGNLFGQKLESSSPTCQNKYLVFGAKAPKTCPAERSEKGSPRKRHVVARPATLCSSTFRSLPLAITIQRKRSWNRKSDHFRCVISNILWHLSSYMLAMACQTIGMDDKQSFAGMLTEHARLFGFGCLCSVATDKGYYSAANIQAAFSTEVSEVGIQCPSNVKAKGNVNEVMAKTLQDRRAGIEPLIGHVKQMGLKRSRMKSDTATLASGYRCVLGFNLRQIGNHLMRDLVKAA